MNIEAILSSVGPSAAYQAGVARLEGDPQPMRRLGYASPSLAEANALMSAAYQQLTPQQQTLDRLDALDTLFDRLHSGKS
jgi:hypothetical protein